MKKLIFVMLFIIIFVSCNDSNDEYKLGLRFMTIKNSYDSTEAITFMITNKKNDTYYLPKCTSGRFMVSLHKKIDSLNYGLYYKDSCTINSSTGIDIIKNQIFYDSLLCVAEKGLYTLELEFGVESHDIDAIIISNEFSIE